MTLSVLKKGRLRSADFEINLFRAAILSVSFCTSFLVEGSTIDSMAFVLSGFAHMPSGPTMQPSIFPLFTPKKHFSGFSLSPTILRFAKVSLRS